MPFERWGAAFVIVFAFVIVSVIAFVIVLKWCPQEALKGEGDMRPSGDGEPMGSLLIYPGCKVVLNDNDEEGLNDYDDDTFSAQVYLFEEPNFEGDFVEYTGPAVMPDPKYIFGVRCSVKAPFFQRNAKNVVYQHVPTVGLWFPRRPSSLPSLLSLVLPTGLK